MGEPNSVEFSGMANKTIDDLWDALAESIARTAARKLFKETYGKVDDGTKGRTETNKSDRRSQHGEDD
jgi:hypothetical protein